MSRFAESLVAWRRRSHLLALLLLCLVAGAAQAQSNADDSADPPTRVARLSYIGGDLGFLPSGAKNWSDANINRPLTTGDKLSSAVNSRAELEFDGGTLRINGQTDFGLLDLNDQLAQIELTQGSLSLTVRQLNDGESYEIDTPTVAVVIDQPGTFRIDVDRRDGSTRVAALDGNATVFGENNARRSINQGRSYRFVDSALSVVTISDINRGDAFDRWASERDNRYAQSTSRQYVSDGVVGYQDLDEYGAWQDSSEYGTVWYPRNVASNWAPYRNGHWAYIGPWGWTWVDDAPWGYAPYHYGRWAYTPRGWGWIPGPRGVRAVYAPALVAFVGGGNWSVGISGAPVGWFPLGPGEIYNPWYRCSRRCYTNVNVYNIHVHGGRDARRDIDDHYNRYRRGDVGRDGRYANKHAPHGFTAVSRRSFGDGHDVNQNRIQVDPRKLVDAPVRPTDINQVRPGERGDRAARTSHVRNLPAGGFNREVVARTAPPDLHDTASSNQRNPGSDHSPGRVRVLGRENAAPDPLTADRPRGIVRRAAAADASLPAVPTITAVNREHPADPARDASEPRSARFNHPRGNNEPAQPDNMPRPGVSYISGNSPSPAEQERERGVSRTRPNTAATLPVVPVVTPANQAREQSELPSSRFVRSRDDGNTRPRENMPRPEANRVFENQPSQSTDERASRPMPPSRFRAQQEQQPERGAAMPQQFERPQPQPRYQRAEPAPRAYVPEAPRPMPTRSQPAPQQYQAPQRASQPQRSEAPQQSAARPVFRKGNPRVEENGQEH